MSRHHNGATAHRLLALWNALQQPSTTFGQVFTMAAECGLDGRRVLADHFRRRA